MSITDELSLEAMIDQTLTDSFPASDPPAWTLGRESQPNLRVRLQQLDVVLHQSDRSGIRNRDVRQETDEEDRP